MKKTRFNTFTYDIVDEISLGQIEKIAELQLDFDPDSLHVPTSSEMQELDAEKVALQLYHPQTGFLKKYACYEPGLTQLNTQLLIQKADRLPDEIVKVAAFHLARACRNQGLTVPKALDNLVENQKLASNVVELNRINETDYYIKTNNGLTKQASAVREWALPHKERYPLDSVEQIEKAASYFNRYYKDFDPVDRLTFATNTTQACKIAGISVTGVLEDYANLDIHSFNDNFNRHVSMRKNFVKEADLEDVHLYDELLEKSAELGVVNSARALEAIDSRFGLEPLWGNRLADPVISTCSMEKEAEIEIDGRYVTQSELDGLAQKDLSGWIDDNTKKELQGPDGLHVLKSLPEPTREGLMSEL